MSSGTGSNESYFHLLNAKGAKAQRSQRTKKLTKRTKDLKSNLIFLILFVLCDLCAFAPFAFKKREQAFGHWHAHYHENIISSYVPPRAI
jgi:hypothetical protein